MTRLLVAGERLSGELPSGAERERLSAWRDALVGLGVISADEQLEPMAQAPEGESGRIVVVVREQLDHLNALYCRAVLELETFEGFESFVDAAVLSGRHDLLDSLGWLFDAPGTEFVAVPYAQAAADPPSPGPVLLTATRLLHKRLSRIRLVRGDDPQADRRAAEHVRQQAATDGWDDTTYWGWSPERAQQTIQRFAPGNAAFAGRAWGTAWPDPPVTRTHTRLDLAGRPPELVSAVLTTIQQALYGDSDPQE